MEQIFEELINKLINNLKINIESVYTNDCHLIILVRDKKTLTKFWTSPVKKILESNLKKMTGFNVNIIRTINEFISIIGYLTFYKCNSGEMKMSLKNKRRKF